MEIVNMAISDLKAYTRNPRKNDAAVTPVANSIKEFGFKVPVVIDKNNTIVCGHTRVKAAKKLKMKTVPCIIADDLTEEQIKAFRLADNKTGELAEWDFDLLAEELSQISAIEMVDFGFEKIKFRPEDIEEDEPPEVNMEETDTVLGDVYVLGEHRLMCGDTTSTEDVEKLMDGVQADMVFTDPPYGLDYETAAGRIQNDNLKKEASHDFLVEAFTNLFTSSKPGAPIYICHADSEGLYFRSAMVETGWESKQNIIWYKSSLVICRQDYQWQHEAILYGWKPGAHNFYGDRKQTTVWEFPKPKKNDMHPTMKPVALCGKAIGNSSREGDLIIDFFGGSGSTMIACEQMNRKCYLMEIDPHYCDVIVRRWEQFTGQKAVKI